MLDFLSHWLSRSTQWSTPRSNTQFDDTEAPGLPLPVVAEKPKPTRKGRDLQKLVGTNGISAPILRSSHSLTGFDAPDYPTPRQYSYPQHSPTRTRPSNVAWLSPSNKDDNCDGKDRTEFSAVLPTPAMPAVVRLPSQHKIYPIGRSVSAPPTSPSSSSSSSSPATPSPKWNLKLNTNPAFWKSTQSLRLDPTQTSTVATDVFGSAYNYPLAKQLSPIPEQDYFSPTAPPSAIAFPGGSKRNTLNLSVARSISNTTNVSLIGSLNSEIARPSPTYSGSLPFIARPLNRTISQTSSRTHASTSSSIPRPSLSSSEPPTLPPVTPMSPFSSPHPNRDSTGFPLRTRRSAIVAMPTITGSSESGGYADEEYTGNEDLESLHAESFVTASDEGGTIPIIEDEDESIRMQGSLQSPYVADLPSQVSVDPRGIPASSLAGALPSMHSEVSRPSASESFINRRWDRDASFGSGVVTFRAKRQWLSCTPAFWAFWLGFVCPFLWLVGGWHFTHFGEQPPRLTFWEFYFNAGYWKEIFCCSKRRRDLVGNRDGTDCKQQAPKQEPRLPRWVTEKQSSDDGRMRLQDPKRSMRGILFGYPFIPRSVSVRRNSQPEVWRRRAIRRIVQVLETPNRLFDLFYGVKLREVRGRPESGRRIFDPWIQRCRYAFCYALILLCVGLCTACTYLIIFNTRQLR